MSDGLNAKEEDRENLQRNDELTLTEQLAKHIRDGSWQNETPPSMKVVTDSTTTNCDSEPEDCIAQAIYLLQLCQQDLNMGRMGTIWPRAKRAREACQALESMFPPNDEVTDGAKRNSVN
jgi:hypothetical protein